MNIGYARISTIKQSTNTSLEYQQQKIKEFCQLKELPLQNIYIEIDSGGNDNRIVLNQIKQLIQSDEISTLLIWKIDRLGRTMLSSLQFIEFCKEHKVRVISVNDNIDTDSDQSSLMLHILLSLATEEKRQINSRCSNGRLLRWNQNKLPYAKLPYGYYRKRNGKVYIDEKVEPIIQYIFRKWNLLSKMKHLTKTKKTQRLLKLLKRNGYTYNGSDFKYFNLRTILSHPLYCGMIKWKDEIKDSDYPTMISKRLWNQVQTSFNA